jgi:methylated-DNA-[protein]-cysteine S-methyltransferase
VPGTPTPALNLRRRRRREVTFDIIITACDHLYLTLTLQLTYDIRVGKQKEQKMAFIQPTARIFHPEFGSISLYLNSDGIYKLSFQPDSPADKQRKPELLSADNDTARNYALSLLEYLNGNRNQLDIPVDWSIFQPFQKAVLELTCNIPFGTINTYGQISALLGNVHNSRAVGTALGRNPIPIIIPCHRVVGADGSLRGYSAPGGIKTKAWLLALEGHHFQPGPSFKIRKG